MIRGSSHKKPAFFFLIFLTSILLIIFRYYQLFLEEIREEKYQQQQQLFIPPRSFKEINVNIVVWYGPSAIKVNNNRIKKLIQLAKTMNKCFENCTVKYSSEQSDVDEADAVFFIMSTKKEDLPKRKDLNQIWIHRLPEPPLVHSPNKDLNDVFNWTISYRRDADINSSMIKVSPKSRALRDDEPLEIEEGKSVETWIKEKKKFGVALISNCNASSRRLEILQNLKASGLQIDVLGQCGSTEGVCLHHEGSCSDFFSTMGSTYKFYFSFENSLCSDYVTEKFSRPLKLGMVPIVLGRAQYKTFAPPASFIDIRDFPNPEDLVEYLHKLDGDDMEYGKYFEWRRKFVMGGSGPDSLSTVCEVCRRLLLYKEDLVGGNRNNNRTSTPIYSNQYPNLAEWWSTAPSGDGPSCITPEEMGLQNYLDINKHFKQQTIL